MTDTPLQDFFSLMTTRDEASARKWLNDNLDQFSPSVRPVVVTLFEEYAHEKRHRPSAKKYYLSGGDDSNVIVEE
jgi:hypothetical protein